MVPHLVNDKWGYEWGHHLLNFELLITCIILLLILIYKFIRLKTGLPKNPPPPFAPYSSISVARASASGTLNWLLLHSARKVGSTFILRIFHRRLLITSDVDACREILYDSSQIKTAGYKMVKKIHGQPNDILTSHGSRHHGRKGMAPAFSSQHIRRMNAVVVKQTKHFMSNKLDQMMDRFDVGEEMIWLTLGIISETAFEYDMNHEEKIMLRNEGIIIVKDAVKDSIIPLRWIFGYLNPATKRARVGTKKNACSCSENHSFIQSIGIANKRNCYRLYYEKSRLQE